MLDDDDVYYKINIEIDMCYYNMLLELTTKFNATFEEMLESSIINLYEYPEVLVEGLDDYEGFIEPVLNLEGKHNLELEIEDVYYERLNELCKNNDMKPIEVIEKALHYTYLIKDYNE